MTDSRDSHPLGRWLKPLHDFLRQEAAAGVLLLIATVFAMLVANSPLTGAYHTFLDLPVTVGIGSFRAGQAAAAVGERWADDVFFLLVAWSSSGAG